MAGDVGTSQGAGDAAIHTTTRTFTPEMRAARLSTNWRVATYDAAFISSLIGVFIILHWARCWATKYQRSKKTPAGPSFITLPFLWISRRSRNILIRSLPGFLSSGHGLLTAIYVVGNVALAFTNVDLKRPSDIAARFGWLCTVNLALVVFLGLKNTPLAILSSYSYERLNNLHQIAGCTTFLMLAIHALTYSSYFLSMNRPEKLREPGQVAGIVATFAFLTMVSTAVLIRRLWYELFYAMHIVCFIVAIIGFSLHRPDFATKTAIVLCVIGGVWVIDRLIRMSRLALNSINNEATVYPLADGGTRILLSKKPAMAVPGKHCFVWIPAVRKFETHPFTIIDTEPMEFVVKNRNGFTRDLHKFAMAHPGAKLTASVDGPYGTFPDPMLYDRIILIAGGSGASFTFGLAVNILERMGPESTKNIVFIWVVKHHENLTWYTDHLRTLHDHPNSPKCKVSLYATRAPASDSSSNEELSRPELQTGVLSSGTSEQKSPTSPEIEKVLHDAESAPGQANYNRADEEKMEVQEFHSEAKGGDTDDDEHGDLPRHGHNRQQSAHKETRVADVEAAGSINESVSSSPLQHDVTHGRPDASTLIRNAVSETPRHQRVLIAACGPPSLMKTVRNTAAECIRPDGPGVELHCEQFGW